MNKISVITHLYTHHFIPTSLCRFLLHPLPFFSYLFRSQNFNFQDNFLPSTILSMLYFLFTVSFSINCCLCNYMTFPRISFPDIWIRWIISFWNILSWMNSPSFGYRFPGKFSVVHFVDYCIPTCLSKLEVPMERWGECIWIRGFSIVSDKTIHDLRNSTKPYEPRSVDLHSAWGKRGISWYWWMTFLTGNITAWLVFRFARLGDKSRIVLPERPPREWFWLFAICERLGYY